MLTKYTQKQAGIIESLQSYLKVMIIGTCNVKKNTFLFFLVFLSGVISANVLGVVLGRELGAMNEYFMNRYMYADIQGRELFPFLFYKRVPEMVLVLFLSIGIYGTFVIDGYIAYLGFSLGFLSVIAIMNYGIRGVLLMAGLFLPQWLFYVPMLILWRIRLRKYKGMEKEYPFGEKRRRGGMKWAVVLAEAAVLVLLGLFMESYVNPFFLQKIIRMLG